jgi:plasmid stability protein
MAVWPVTVNLPDSIYGQLKRRAEQTQRSVEDELLEVVAASVPEEAALPSELSAAVAALSLLDDEALWRAARSHLPVTAAARLEALHLQRQHTALSPAEADELSGLVQQYEQAMLVRAQAAALLHERGHDISPLLATDKP